MTTPDLFHADRQIARLVGLVDELRALPSETEWVEFKENFSDAKAIGERISALSNGARLQNKEMAYMVWGIQDVTHKVVGTNFRPDATKDNEPLKFWLMKRLSPCPDINFEFVPHPEGRLIILHIPSARELPITFDRISRVRIGSATPPLRDFPEVEKKLLAKLRAFVWESDSVAKYMTGEEVLDLLDHDAFIRLKGLSRPIDNAGILVKLLDSGMISKDVNSRWNILNLGAILFARNLSQFPSLERKSLRIIQYTGRNRLNAKPEQSWGQGYAAGFVAYLKFLNGILPARELIGAIRTEDRVYPSEAIKELLANALIHQDMTVSGSGPKVEIFEDRIEFNNPGAPLTDWKKLFGAEPRSRNERLALAMRLMDLCEERGSGLRRTITATIVARLVPPEFQSVDDFTRVVLHGHSRDFDTMDQAARIRAAYYYSMLLWDEGKWLTNVALRDRFGLPASAAAKISVLFRACVAGRWIRVADPERPNSGYVPYYA